MNIRQVTLRHLKMPMKTPFRTSLGVELDQEFILVELKNQVGMTGWAESVAESVPFYKEETVKTNWHIIKDFLIPILRKQSLSHPNEVSHLFSHIRRNYMAKAAIEQGVWDLYANMQNEPLAKTLGGSKSSVDVGVSLGIKDSIEELIEEIAICLAEGYKRIKMKIEPGWDVNAVEQVREAYPDIPLMVDANSAYTLQDIDHLKKLDRYKLMMIEQPLSHDDIIDHATLQSQIKTPICLDESICSVEDARKAINLGSCKIINIKVGRVGGFTPAIQIHDLCKANDIPVWCGGMCESGVGRGHNIALSTLSNFTLPGDTAASSRYWKQDIIKPEVTVENGEIRVPANASFGYEVDLEQVDFYTQYKETFDLQAEPSAKAF